MKILVVVDMQNDFVTGALGTEEARAIVPKVVEKLKNISDDTYIIFTKDTHFDNYMETQEGKNLPVLHCIKGTDGWEIIPELAILFSNPPIVEKGTFGGTGLITLLQDIEKRVTIDEIEFIGVCTGICVISNALLVKAFYPEIPITVDASCCACVTPETHENALETMKVCHINIKGE